ncbi:NUDIX domain-containing protein [Hyalangium gracile]|uniref:NUDIX domain-containing protein n=1 Tax=Hyalangium gracile TaxID=394092 RepID=UPI001CC9D28B|nr:NUDIX hydrolase [Hyalangium gracile]
MDEHKNPWKTLSSRQVYDNPWIRVREDQVINPSGSPGIYGVVSFKNTAVGIVPVDAEGYTYLVGQFRYPLDAYSWEIPEGGAPKGTDVLESARRELKEETGFTAARWTHLCRIHTSNSVTSEEGFIFLAEELTAGSLALEETEDITVKRVSLQEAVRMVMNDEITDSMSIAGILKVARLKGL